MPIVTPVGSDALVNTNTASGQITPRVVALAGGRYMVVWVGEVTVPVVPVGGTFAPSYANADIRGQIFNADGTPSGTEFVINTTTAGGQLRPVVAQLSNGDVLVTWHDGVGPAGGSAETTPNTLRGQRFTSAGVASGSEFVIGNSNGRPHSVAATAGGGFVVTYQQGGIGGSLAPGDFIAQRFDAANGATSSITFDNSQPVGGHNGSFVAVEADGDMFIYWTDFQSGSGNVPRVHHYDSTGALLNTYALATGSTIWGVTALATGGHAVIYSRSLGAGQPIAIYLEMQSVDGSLTTGFEVAQVPSIVGSVTITPLANGGVLASWPIDSDPGAGTNREIMARAYNGIGNPMGPAFQVNSITALSQSTQAFAQLTNGDIVGAWIDESLTTADSSQTAITMRQIDYDPVNQNPSASNFTATVGLSSPATTPFDLDPAGFDQFFGVDGYDADGDPLVISAVSNPANGTVSLNGDGTISITVAAGATAPFAFDYTVSDGQGGTATARATLIFPNDFAAVRPGSVVEIDFLANDFYVPQPGATPFTATLFANGGSGQAGIVSTPQGLRLRYDPLAPTPGTLFQSTGFQLDSPWFTTPVGSSVELFVRYQNNQISGDAYITLEGWAQLGGAGDDNLTGTALADHLSGGAGVNVLTGFGGNDWYTVSNATTTIVEAAGGGTDSVRSSVATYVLPDNVENLFLLPNQPSPITLNWTGNAGDNHLNAAGNTIGGVTFFGLGGNDRLVGSSDADVLDGGDGNDFIDGGAFGPFLGHDTIRGGAGDDVISFSAFPSGFIRTFSPSDVVDGGTGTDQVGISGNYTGSDALVLNATTLTNVEVLALLPGAGNSYAITMHDGNVAAGVEMTIFAGNLGAGQNFTFNGAAETDGFFRTFGGLGTDTITGGGLSDGFYFGPNKWQAGDSVTGGGGTNDQLALDGDYTVTIGTSADVEVLVLLASPDAGNPNDFNITLADAWTSGAARTVFGRNNITAMTVNGAAESSANLTIFGGRAGDILTTGGGADTIYGLEGNDLITGGAGANDTAVYQGARASYSVVTGGGNVQIVDNDAVADGDDGTDTVVGIEFAQFSDQTISITSPIILDLDGGGVSTLSAGASNARFDMDGDGIGDDTSWFGRGEGLLFLDRDGNGTLSNAGEMSFTGDVANARSDLEGLRAWDSNGDGELSRRDARFADFKIWRDRNGDGVVDRREVMTLRQAGVRSLSLTGVANSGTYALGDTAIVNTGSFTRTNGRQGGLIDAVLTAVSSKAETDALAAMRDAVASDLGGSDTDPRLALMTQDMASFGPTRAATETDRWRREGVPQFDMFAA